MPNIINENGLQTKTVAEMQAEIFAKLRLIYGTDINLGSESPDTQLAMIYIQATRDILDVIEDVFQSFDPDQAVGRVLDMRAALNGIQRKAGTNTILPIEVEVDASLTLYGVDQDVEEVFTVADDAGTQFVLSTTEVINAPGTYSLIFQAQEVGKVEVQPNTITEIVTVTLGVVSVNNPGNPISVGIDEETDLELRERRRESTAISGKGWKDSLTAALRNINGVNVAAVYENKTNADPDSRGIPSHSIWALVSGVYNDIDVAMAIYTKRNAGAGMKGAKSYAIIDDEGDAEVMRWDDLTTEDLFIKLDLDPINPDLLIDINAIKEGLVEKLKFKIGATYNANQIAYLVQTIDPNALVNSVGFSLTSGGTYTPTIKNSSLDKIFLLAENNITVLPLQILPLNAEVIGGATPETRQFLAFGGYGAYTWSVLIDNSGAGGTAAVIDANGVYTPGDQNTGVLDTIKVVDSVGNEQTVQVEVIAE